jgi:hypothetical protein
VLIVWFNCLVHIEWVGVEPLFDESFADLEPQRTPETRESREGSPDLA